MPVTLNTFAETFGLRLLAGAEHTVRRVRWVHVSELLDPSPYLRGGELLLLAGVNLTGGREECDRYVRALTGAGVVGVGFGITPVHDLVPPEMVRACRAHDLPLLEIPGTLPFESLGELLYAQTLADELSTMKRFTDAQRELTAAVTGAAALPTVLQRLVAHVGGWALVVDHNRRREWSAGDPRLDEDTRATMTRIAAGTAPAGASLATDDQAVLVHWLPGPLPSGYALAVGTRSPLDATGRAVVALAAAILPLLLAAPADAWRAQDIGALLVRALASGEDGVGEAAAALVRSPQDHWRVVHCLARPGRTPPRSGDGPAVAAVLRTPFVAATADEVVAVCRADTNPDAFLPELARYGWHPGASRAHPWAELRVAAREASRAARTASVRGVPVVDGGRRGGVFALTDPRASQAWADGVLAPLRAERLGQELLTTLRVWLARHGNWDRTANDLDIHRNSVRNRIGQIARLLDRDLTDAQTRMDLWFALHWIEADTDTTSAGGPDVDGTGDPAF